MTSNLQANNHLHTKYPNYPQQTHFSDLNHNPKDRQVHPSQPRPTQQQSHVQPQNAHRPLKQHSIHQKEHHPQHPSERPRGASPSDNPYTNISHITQQTHAPNPNNQQARPVPPHSQPIPNQHKSHPQHHVPENHSLITRQSQQLPSLDPPPSHLSPSTTPFAPIPPLTAPLDLPLETVTNSTDLLTRIFPLWAKQQATTHRAHRTFVPLGDRLAHPLGLSPTLTDPLKNVLPCEYIIIDQYKIDIAVLLLASMFLHTQYQNEKAQHHKCYDRYLVYKTSATKLEADYAAVCAERDELVQINDTISAEIDTVSQQRAKDMRRVADLKMALDERADELDALHNDHAKLFEEAQSWDQHVDALKHEITALKVKLEQKDIDIAQKEKEIEKHVLLMKEKEKFFEEKEKQRDLQLKQVEKDKEFECKQLEKKISDYRIKLQMMSFRQENLTNGLSRQNSKFTQSYDSDDSSDLFDITHDNLHPHHNNNNNSKIHKNKSRNNHINNDEDYKSVIQTLVTTVDNLQRQISTSQQPPNTTAITNAITPKTALKNSTTQVLNDLDKILNRNAQSTSTKTTTSKSNHIKNLPYQPSQPKPSIDGTLAKPLMSSNNYSTSAVLESSDEHDDMGVLASTKLNAKDSAKNKKLISTTAVPSQPAKNKQNTHQVSNQYVAQLTSDLIGGDLENRKNDKDVPKKSTLGDDKHVEAKKKNTSPTSITTTVIPGRKRKSMEQIELAPAPTSDSSKAAKKEKTKTKEAKSKTNTPNKSDDENNSYVPPPFDFDEYEAKHASKKTFTTKTNNQKVDDDLLDAETNPKKHKKSKNETNKDKFMSDDDQNDLNDSSKRRKRQKANDNIETEDFSQKHKSPANEDDIKLVSSITKKSSKKETKSPKLVPLIQDDSDISVIIPRPAKKTTSSTLGPTPKSPQDELLAQKLKQFDAEIALSRPLITQPGKLTTFTSTNAKTPPQFESYNDETIIEENVFFSKSSPPSNALFADDDDDEWANALDLTKLSTSTNATFDPALTTLSAQDHTIITIPPSTHSGPISRPQITSTLVPKMKPTTLLGSVSQTKLSLNMKPPGSVSILAQKKPATTSSLYNPLARK